MRQVFVFAFVDIVGVARLIQLGMNATEGFDTRTGVTQTRCKRLKSGHWQGQKTYIRTNLGASDVGAVPASRLAQKTRLFIFLSSPSEESPG